MVFLSAQQAHGGQGKVAVEHMSYGSNRVEDVSYHNVCSAPALGGYVAQFTDFVEFEPEEVVDTGMQRHRGMRSMA